MRYWKWLAGVAVVGGVVGLVGLAWPAAAADEKKASAAAEPDKAAVERAKEQARMLDELYKTAVVGITKTYVNQQGDTPAATVAKQVFEAMKKGKHHTARLVDATGNPKDAENQAKTAFEKKAVEDFKAGKKEIEEVGETDGKPVYRYATPVPALMKQCATCHGVKMNDLLGALVYELPIK
jgi:hypothetical protein